jgi:Zn ribbon nucleic-acid-binding protein
MSDISCPYCGYDQDVNDLDEDELHEHECGRCGKNFVYMVVISVHCEPAKADCLNGSEHKFKPTGTFPVRYSRMRCVDCGLERQPTDSEWDMINSEWDMIKSSRS